MIRATLTLTLALLLGPILFFAGDAPSESPPPTATPAPKTCEPSKSPSELIAKVPRPPVSSNDVVRKPELIQRVQPDYPPELRRGGVQGKVILEVIVASDGSVGDLRVVASPDPALSQLACEAVYQWRFKPGTLNGTPIPVYSIFTLDFSIPKEEPTPERRPRVEAN